jgi:hypothetical protein
MGDKFDDLDKDEKAEILWILLLCLAIAAGIIAAIICTFKGDWSSAAGFALCAAVLWWLVKFLFSDK